MEQSNEIWILNPDYSFKNDKDRICMYAVDECRHDGATEWVGFIHPDQALILAFFSSAEDYNDNILQLASHFNIPFEKMDELVSGFKANPTSIFTLWKEQPVVFPRNVLIKVSEKEAEEATYQFELSDLKIDQPLNLTRDRMHLAPHSLLWMLTNRCITRCQYCYADTFTKNNELSTERTLELFQEAKDLGVEYIDIIGGEILLKKDWDILVKFLVDNSMSPHFISTKVPVSEKIYEKLKETGFSKLFQVSLDSLDEEILKVQVRCSDGYVEQVKEGIERLQKLPVQIHINTVLTTLNTNPENIKELFDYLKGIRNLKQWEIRVPEVSLYTSESFKRMMPSREQIVKLKEYVDKEIIPNAEGVNISFTDEALNRKFRCTAPEEPSFDGGLCGYLHTRFFVLPDGKVSICEQLYWHPDFIIGDLKENSIAEVWQSEKAYNMFALPESMYRKESPCRKCASFEDCRLSKRRCFVKVVKAYGMENWDYPDPRCILAPEMNEGLEYK